MLRNCFWHSYQEIIQQEIILSHESEESLSENKTKTPKRKNYDISLFLNFLFSKLFKKNFADNKSYF
jgi:hypothetical protein